MLGSEQAVRLAGGRVALFPGRGVDTDIASYERRAGEVLRSADRAAARALAAEYPADLLPDLPYAEWTQEPRERLRARHVAVLRLGGEWERLVAAEPTDEHAHRELMRTALGAGAPHTAIRWYGRLRTHLEGQLGLPPSAESRALYEECVARLPSRRRRWSAGSPSSPGWPRLCARPGALVLRGAPGIGKSTLCRELAVLADDGGWRVATVTAGPARGAYAALSALVHQLLGRDRTLLDRLPAQARAVLAQLTALAGPRAQGELTRHMVIGAVHRLVAAHREVRGVLLVVDDAHLADEATVEACEQLARADGDVLVALAYRSESAPRALARAVAGLDRAGRCTTIELGPLGEAEIAALVGVRRPGPPDADRGDGRGQPVLRAGAGPGRGVAVGVGRDHRPRARPRRADGGAAAQAGRGRRRPRPVRRARARPGCPSPRAFALLDVALDAGALVAAGTRYRFRHDLVRQALVEQVPPHRRLDIHRDAARSLAAAGAAPSLVARHWLDGGCRDEAEPWLLAAARRAWSLGAFADALDQLDPLLAHRPEHTAALRLRAEVLDALGDRRAPAAYAAAAEAAADAEAHDLRAMQALAEIKQGDPAGRPAHAGRAGADVAAGQAGPGAGLQRRRRDGLRHPGAGHRHGGGVPQAGAGSPATGPRW